MSPLSRTASFALAALVLAASCAAAQEAPSAPPAAPAERPSLKAADVCAPERSVPLCLEPKLEIARIVDKEPRSPSPTAAGRLTRLTRLAGMFMGRVDVVELAGLKVRIDLELR